MNDLKTKVLADARKQLDANPKTKRGQKKAFEKLYDKTKIIQRKTEINMNTFIYLPKQITTDNNNNYLTTSELSIYIVLCLFADFKDNKWFQLSQANIARMSGLATSTVISVIKKLIDKKFYFICNEKKYYLLNRQKITDQKRHYYLYQVNFVRKNMIKDMKGQFFSFFKCTVTGGVWANLKPRAKMLYIILRTVSKFEFILYNEIENEEEGTSYFEYSEDFDYSDAYLNRKWDVCFTSLTELCRIGNIEHTNIKSTIEQLEHFRLIEKVGDFFKVYLKPDKMVRF